MRYFQTFARSLLRLPATWRLWIVLLCTVGCEAFFLLLSYYLYSLESQRFFIVLIPLGQTPCLLAIPMVVAAWFYRKRGIFLCLSSMAVTTWIFYAVHFSSMVISHPFIMNFCTGALALLVTGLFVSSKRDALEQAEERKQQLAWAYNEEMRLNQAKDQFLQNVNHELKTPLTALGASLELLQQRHEHLNTDDRATLIQSASSSCEELQTMVNNILECLQVDEQEPRDLLLWEMQLRGVIKDVMQQADAGWLLYERVNLEVDEGLVVWANARSLRQLLRNLLSNAVKYTPGHLPIGISACRTNHPLTLKPEICVSVKDWGPGICPEDSGRIFGQFVRLERDALGEVRGSGLGLYVSRHLVEAMGGRIWVESSGIPGEGSCFSFTLPAATLLSEPVELFECAQSSFVTLS